MTTVERPQTGTRRRHSIFKDDHDDLRASIRRFVDERAHAAHRRVGGRRRSRTRSSARLGELGFLGLDKPEEYGGQGGDYFSAS